LFNELEDSKNFSITRIDSFNEGVHVNKKEVKQDSNSTSMKYQVVSTTSSLKSIKKVSPKVISRSKSIDSSLHRSKGSLDYSKKLMIIL